MTRSGRVSVLVHDPDPASLEDYQIIFGPVDGKGNRMEPPGANFETELYLSALPSGRVPEVELSAGNDGRAAINAVGKALAEECPFHVAFIDLGPAPGHWGLDIAQRIRDLDPNLHIVLTAARYDHDSSELCAWVPPADRLSVLCKPFLPLEVQQQVASAVARRIADETAGRSWAALADRVSKHTQAAQGPNRQVPRLADTLLLVRNIVDSLLTAQARAKPGKGIPRPDRRLLRKAGSAQLSLGSADLLQRDRLGLRQLSEEQAPFVNGSANPGTRAPAARLRRPADK